MVRIRHAVLILLAFGCVVVCGKEEEPFYDQLCRGVIRLEHVEVIQKEQVGRLETGTAFFVGSGNELYVVSARHVVEKGHNLCSRVRLLNPETRDMAMFWLELPHGDWVYHPNNGDKDTHFVDVAAMKIRVPRAHIPRLFLYEPADPNMKQKNQLPSEDVPPPELILVFGFPELIGFTLLEQRPMVRLGVISMSAGKEFLRYSMANDPNTLKFAEERCCLIDARMFLGNSGSPVMNQPRLGSSKPRLLGLVIATSRTLDFGVMEPVSRIRETLDVAKTKPAGGIWNAIPEKTTPKKTPPIAGPDTPN